MIASLDRDMIALQLDCLREQGERRLLVLCGERGWALAEADKLVNGCSSEDLLWLTDQPREPRVKVHRAGQYLGQEKQLVLLDAWAGFDPDGFGAVAGTLRAGGLLILLIPQNWSQFADPDYDRLAAWPATRDNIKGFFLQRLERVLAGSKAVWWVSQQQQEVLLHLPRKATWKQGQYRYSCLTADQQQMVERLLELPAFPSAPFVVTADRGRGKSAGLGLAAAQLLGRGLNSIVVTAPRQAATEPLFRHCAEQLAGAKVEPGLLEWQGRTVRFVAPDALLLEQPQADLLMVDEAAAIPAPLLEQMLRLQQRRSQAIVYASTIHGYEGTGRGFAVRFRKTLSRLAPGWQKLAMKAPIRWCSDEPLEGTINRALLLDAEPATEVSGACFSQCSIEWLSPSQLGQDEERLGQLFGLLVLAHYRTSPADLRNLLDGPNVRIAVMTWQRKIVATALLAREGGFPAELALAIWAGSRRPRGHLLPQSLAAHGGYLQAPLLQGERIMRIAVHPELQQRGFGSRLVQEVARAARAQGLDWLGTSFGASLDLLAFWQRNGLQPVRLGVTREASSGSHAVQLLQPLSNEGQELFRLAHARFVQQLPDVLASPLIQLEPELEEHLLQLPFVEADEQLSAQMDHQQWLDLIAFCWGHRTFESAEPAIRLFAKKLADKVSVEAMKVRLQVSQDWGLYIEHFKLSGHKAARNHFKSALRKVLEHSLPPEYLSLREMLECL